MIALAQVSPKYLRLWRFPASPESTSDLKTPGSANDLPSTLTAWVLEALPAREVPDPQPLSLRELGRFSGLVQAGLLALDLAGVPREEALPLEWHAKLRIGLDGPDEITLHLTGGAPGSPVPLALTAPPPASDLPAYGRVFRDLLRGGSTLSVRGDEAEEAWRVVAPVLEAWKKGLVPLDEYPAGSPGPPALDAEPRD